MSKRVLVNKTWENLVFKVLADLIGGLFDLRQSLWFLLLNLCNKGPIKASKALFFYERQLFPWIKVSFSKQANWPIEYYRDFRIVKEVGYNIVLVF